MTTTNPNDVEVTLEPQLDLSPALREPTAITVPRPYKFTPEAQRKILVAFQMGHFLETAAAYGAVQKRTLMTWLERGAMAGPEAEGLEKEFYDFTELCTQARAASKVGLVAIAWRHARADGKVAIALMEKLFPEEYGKKTTKEVTGKVEVEHKKVDYSNLSDEELEQAEKLALKTRRQQLKDDIIDAEIIE